MRFSGWMRTSAFWVRGRGGGAHGHPDSHKQGIVSVLFVTPRYSIEDIFEGLGIFI